MPVAGAAAPPRRHRGAHLRTERGLEPVANLIPAALILGLLLAPDDLACILVLRKIAWYSSEGKGYICSRRTIATAWIFASRAPSQIEIDFALQSTTRATADALVVDIVDHVLKPPARVPPVAIPTAVTQQTLRGHDDQRLSQRPHHLTAQHVKTSARGSRDAHLDIVFRRRAAEKRSSRAEECSGP